MMSNKIISPSKEIKFSVDHMSGGEKGFIFRNMLIQQLITNNLFDPNSPHTIEISVSTFKKYLSTSISKVSSRTNISLEVNVKTYNKIKKFDMKNFRKNEGQCYLFNRNYSNNQIYLITDASADLSNINAENDIHLINSLNATDKIIDDLLLNTNRNCLIIE